MEPNECRHRSLALLPSRIVHEDAMREQWNHRGTGPVLCITPREKDALQLLADGNTASELSRCLALSASEVESLLAGVFAAMGAATQTEAIAAAQTRGLLRRGPTSAALQGSDERPDVDSGLSAPTAP